MLRRILAAVLIISTPMTAALGAVCGAVLATYLVIGDTGSKRGMAHAWLAIGTITGIVLPWWGLSLLARRMDDPNEE